MMGRYLAFCSRTERALLCLRMVCCVVSFAITPVLAVAVTCPDGYFLQKNGETESDCKKCTKVGKFICKSVNVSVSSDEDLFNLDVCKPNQRVNSDTLVCEKSETTYTCPAGTYLDYDKCVSCTNESLLKALTFSKEQLSSSGFARPKIWKAIQEWYNIPYNRQNIDADTLSSVDFVIQASAENLNQWFCPGFYNAMIGDNDFIYGVKKCPDGQFANSDSTGCVSETAVIASAAYEQQNATATTSNITIQRTTPVSYNLRQTIASASLSNFNTDRNTQCSAGYVWFNNRCTSCTSNEGWIRYARENRRYCPGGNNLSNKQIVNQTAKCPAGMRPNADLSDCVCIWGTKSNNKCTNVNLTTNDLYYGPNGSDTPFYKQCWIKTDALSYRHCMGFD